MGIAFGSTSRQNFRTAQQQPSELSNGVLLRIFWKESTLQRPYAPSEPHGEEEEGFF